MAAEWSDALEWDSFKLIYISYGSMDFTRREDIRQGAIVETYQNRPPFFNSIGELVAPYLCISIDDYPSVQVVSRKARDGSAYTFVQLPSKRMEDLQPITEKLVTLLRKKHPLVQIGDEERPYLLYIANFIKFKDATARNIVQGTMIANHEIETEGNRVAEYLQEYAPHFYQWMGYMGFPLWLYKPECIPESIRPMLVPMLRERFREGLPPATLQSCFLHLGFDSDQHYEVLVQKGGKRKRTRKYKKCKIVNKSAEKSGTNKGCYCRTSANYPCFSFAPNDSIKLKRFTKSPYF